MELQEDLFAQFKARLQGKIATISNHYNDAHELLALNPVTLGALAPLALKLSNHHDAADEANLLARRIWQSVQDTDRVVYSPQDAESIISLLRQQADGDANRLARSRKTVFKVLKNLSGSLTSAAKDDLQSFIEPRGDSVLDSDNPSLRLILAAYISDSLVQRVFSDEVMHSEDCDLLHQQFAVLKEMPFTEAALFLEGTSDIAYGERRDEELEPIGQHPLSQCPSYMAFAEDIWRQGLDRLRAIHSGQISYQPDKGMLPCNAQVLGYAARVGLDNDAKWLNQTLAETWLLAATAPSEKAKTMPSQSLAIALGRAVEDRPGFTGIMALREVLGKVRHAGIAKKLDRIRKTAERRLSLRPDFLDHIPPGEKLPAKLMATVRQSLEKLYRRSRTFTLDEWQARVFEHQQVFKLAKCLIWSLETGHGGHFSAVPSIKKGHLIWITADGSMVESRDIQRIHLWHPLPAEAQARTAWRDYVVTNRLQQPFKQAFREFYLIPEEERQKRQSSIFAGYWVNTKPINGIAQSEGWRTDRDLGFTLTVGDYFFSFYCGGFYPGFIADIETGSFSVDEKSRNSRYANCCFDQLDPVLLSEVLRNVDLMVSVGARAYDPEKFEADFSMQSDNSTFCGENFFWSPSFPQTHSVQMRHQVLERLYKESFDVSIEKYHVVVGGVRIHIATGRTTRNGEPFDVPLLATTDKLSWLPHKDLILEQIARQIAALGK